jgi:hypothetical protein
MAAQDRTTLKGYFTGTPTFSTPSEAEYIDLIDSFLNLTDDGLASGYGLWRLTAAEDLYYELATLKYWGIGTATPSAKLHLVETADVPFVNIGNNNLTGGRAVVIGEANANTGDYALAIGSDNDVSEAYSCALGDQNIVGGQASYAFGGSNEIGTNTLSFAFGNTNTIGDSGSNAYAFGDGCAIGDSCQEAYALGVSITIGNSCNRVFGFGSGITITGGHDDAIVWSDGNAATTSKGDKTFFVKYLGGIYLQTPKLNLVDIPTASAGLASGDVWSDGGTLKIIP